MGRLKKQVKTEIKQELEGEKSDGIPYIDIDSDTAYNADNEYTYTQLESMTARQLAEIAENYINASAETIVKWSKKDIIKVIQNKGYDKEPKARIRDKADTRNLVNSVLDFLESVKFDRDEKKLYKPLKEVFANNSVNLIEEKTQGADMHGASKVIVAITGALLLTDALIGFKNLGTFYKKIKEKFSKKTEHETKQAK
ncbi:MAG: hypothetical protein LBB59_00950 [Campylobacteraceae bacterium]|jgi:hypothetical protein|nr:hypothetical protein [Campylobacteraceae bacterium]